MFDFSQKTVVVTGSSRGIGKCIAERFWKAGANIAITSHSQKEIELAAHDIAGGAESSRILGMSSDNSNINDIHRTLDMVIERFGGIDILVNNAGVQFPKTSMEVTENDWDMTLDTNLKGTFFANQYVAKDIQRRKAKGAIVNIGSVQGITVVLGQAVYASTKAGISQLTKSLAREWGKSGIRVNCVAPGSIPTAINASIYADHKVLEALEERLPLSRQGTLNEVADAVLFLASDYSSYITGQTLYVDGGLTLCHG